MPSRSAPPPSAPLWKRPLLWAALAGACFEILLVAVTTIPLGVPGEWNWQRLPGETATPGMLLLGGLSALPAAAVYLAVCHFGCARIESQSRVGRMIWLLSLSAAAFAWIWCLIDASPDPIHRLGRGPVVHYYDAFSGYFLDARKPDDFSAALAEYELKMAEGDVLHIGTHPPGLMIAHRGLLGLLRASPGLTDFVLATRPASVRAVQEQILAPFPVHDGSPLTDADFAALWAATLIVILAAALTVIPLYVLATAAAGPVAGWKAACFWPLVPALAVFIPKSDALLPLISTAVLAAWWLASARTRWRVIVAASLFWLGMLITLAMLTVGGLLFLLTLQNFIRTDKALRRGAIIKTIGDVLFAGAIFVILTLLFWFITDVNLPNVWLWNYRNHGAFYEEYDRTYWKWLLVNPLELSLAIGLPVLAVMLVRWRHIEWKSSPLLPVVATIALLWLSGKNAGEAARLWLFLTPWVLWTCGLVWSNIKDHALWLCVLILQMATAFVVASRVSGFEFQRFLGGGA